ncbi:hypothetical protein SAMN05444275_12042 [Myroides odoratimimus subsp. xuanwuensis]|nr:hypothetical protein SAMN05444275_12042 [Myroides odoratimimus subsp. xuanwuensis]
MYTFLKLLFLEDHKAEGVNEMIKKNIHESSIVLTNKSTSYVDISDFVQIHITEKSSEQTLKWGHTYLIYITMKNDSLSFCYIDNIFLL